MHAIFRYNAVLGEVVDRILNESEVVLGDGFQVSRTRCQSTTEWREVRHHLLQQLSIVAKSFTHDLLE